MRSLLIVVALLCLVSPCAASSRPPAFATVHYHNDTGYDLTFSESDTYYRAEPTTTVTTTSMVSNRCTGQTTATIIVGPNGAGHYDVGLAVSFNGVAANTYEFEVYLDDVGQDAIDQRRTIGTGADTGCIAVTGKIYIQANTEVSVRGQNVGSTGTANIKRLTLSIDRTGP